MLTIPKMRLTSSRFPSRSLIPLLSAVARCSLSSGAAVSGEARSEKLNRIANELLDLSETERQDYSILFSLKLGLEQWGPAGAVAQAAGGAASPAAEAAEEVKEKTAFDVKLEKFEAAAKIKVIKEVRAFADLGLKEAKEMVEKAPVVVKRGVTKEEAEAMASKLKEAGATVVLE